MKRHRSIVLFLHVLTLGAAGIAAPSSRSGVIANGTNWATAWHVIESGRTGPTVMVTAGVHGDEPAGPLALEQVRCWPIAKGRLVLVPRCNPVALAAGSRVLPEVPQQVADLNRNFPRAGKDEPARGEGAPALWAFVQKHRPDFLIDLHEGTGFRAGGSKSVGASIIRGLHRNAGKLQALMLQAVNDQIDDANRKLVPLRRAADGSLARAADDHLGIPAFICETAMKGQAVALRVRQHRLMLHALLKHLGMTDAPPIRITPPKRPSPQTLYVARYNGPGAGYNTVPDRFEGIFADDKEVLIRRVGPDDVRDGVLDQFDAVLFPGGSGSGQANGLGEGGRQLVRRFVEGGGGYIGICGGAYLATANYKWSLRIIDACSIDTKHWRRGNGDVRLGLTDAGRRLLGCEKPEVTCRFAQGPILAPAGRDDIADYTVLAVYRTGIGTNGADPNTMVETPALVTGTFGKGRVAVISPHPDATPGLQSWLGHLVHWAARRR
jgi:predicted deacylase/putative intracellular protease/amidase